MYVALFDIDSTLLRTRGAGRAAFEETFRADFDIEEIGGDISYAGRSDRAIVREVFAQHGVVDLPDVWQRFQRGYLERLEFALAARSGALLPGVPALLKAIRDRRDIVAGILTGNVAAGARLKLRHYGIDSFFDFGGFGDEHADRGRIAADALDAADAFLRTQYALAARPERTTVIRRHAGRCAMRPIHRGEGDRGGDRRVVRVRARGGGARPGVPRPHGSRRHSRDHHRCLMPGAAVRLGTRFSGSAPVDNSRAARLAPDTSGVP